MRKNKITDTIQAKPSILKKNIIAVYIRESTQEQGVKGFNIHMQRRKILEYIKMYNYKGTVKIYQDHYSAKTTDRPQLNELKEDVRKGRVKTVIVYNLDRLVRRLKGLQEMFELFLAHEVKFMSVSEKIDTKTPFGLMLANLIVMIAQWEQDTISMRTNNGLIEGAKHGYWMKGKIPFGYNKVGSGMHNILILNKDEQRVIHKMRDMLREGYSIYAIKLALKEDEYMQSIGVDYSENMIVRILKQKVNIGIMELKGVEYKLDVNPVFTEEEYEEVLQLLSERAKTSKYNYLFAGKVRNTKGEAASLKSTVKPNNVYLYYYDEATKKRVNEAKVLEEVMQKIKEDQTVYKTKQGCTYENDLMRIEKKRKEVNRMYKLCMITSEDYQHELLEIEKAEKKAKNCYKKYVIDIRKTFDKLDEEKKELFVWKHVKYINIDYQTKEIIVS